VKYQRQTSRAKEIAKSKAEMLKAETCDANYANWHELWKQAGSAEMLPGEISKSKTAMLKY
jgi:hypothetical protein